jgi:hypothetical protein
VCGCASRQSLGEGGLADLEATREDVVQEVLNTPRRREDNDITRLTEKMHLLQVGRGGILTVERAPSRPL